MVVEVRKEWFMFHVFEPLAGPVFCPPPKKAKKKVEKKEVVSKKNKIKEPEKPCDSCKKMQDEAIRLLRKW
jgi:hypothetical protein